MTKKLITKMALTLTLLSTALSHAADYEASVLECDKAKREFSQNAFKTAVAGPICAFGVSSGNPFLAVPGCAVTGKSFLDTVKSSQDVIRYCPPQYGTANRAE
jgi:hypothetical protein